jgi:hypothetical protein
MRRLLLAACGLLLSFTAQAQTTATITGTVLDLSSTPVTSGQVTFTLMPGIDTTISGTARFARTAVTCGINGSGLIKNAALNGACVVTKGTAMSPSGTYYNVCLLPYNVKTQCFNTYIYGDLDISTPVPTPTTAPAYSFVDKISNQADIGGNKTFTGIVSFSLPIIPLSGIDGEIYMSAYSGDWCSRFAQAHNALPSTGGTINGYGLPGVQPCAQTVVISKPVHFKGGCSQVVATVSPVLDVEADFEIDGPLSKCFSIKAKSAGTVIAGYATVAGVHRFVVKDVELIGNGVGSAIVLPDYQSQILLTANSGAQRTSNVATITFLERHQFRVGDSIDVSGVTDSTFNVSNVTVTAVTSTTLTYANGVNPNVGAATAGGGYVIKHGFSCPVAGCSSFAEGQTSITNNVIHGFGDYAVWLGQSVYFDTLDSNLFYDNNGDVNAEAVADFSATNNVFEFRQAGTHTNPHLRTKGGSKCNISDNEFMNNEGDMTTADILLEVNNLQGSGGHCRIINNYFKPEGEAVQRAKIRIAATGTGANSLANWAWADISHNEFFGNNASTGYALQFDNPIASLNFDDNGVVAMNTVINDNATSFGQQQTGRGYYGCGNTITVSSTGVTNTNTARIFVNGGRYFNFICDRDSLTSDPTLPVGMAPAVSEATQLNNRVKNSAFTGIPVTLGGASQWSITQPSISTGVITSVARAGGTTVTVVTSADVNVTAGFSTNITGVTDAANFPNGSYVVATVTDLKHFTLTWAGANVSSSGGDVQPYYTKATSGQTDRDGGTSAVLFGRAGKTASEAIATVIDLTNLPSNLFITFWAKAGSCGQVQFGLYDSTTTKFQGSLSILTLGSAWTFHKFPVRGIGTGDTYSLQWYGGNADNAQACDFYLYAPQVSDQDSEYLPTTGSALTITTSGNYKMRTPIFASGVLLGGAVNNVKLTGTFTAARTLTLQDVTGTAPVTIASGTSALGTSAISATSCATVVTTAATNALSTDTISWAFNAAPSTAYTSGVHVLPYVTANNVNFLVCNPTAGSLTPAAATLNWRVIR